MLSASTEVRDVMQRSRSRGTYEDCRRLNGGVSRAGKSLSATVVGHGASLAGPAAAAAWKLLGPSVRGESGTPSLPQPHDELVDGVSGSAAAAPASSSSSSPHQFHQSTPVRSSAAQTQQLAVVITVSAFTT